MLLADAREKKQKVKRQKAEAFLAKPQSIMQPGLYVETLFRLSCPNQRFGLQKEVLK
jgi:hypothetical protein